MTDDTTNVIIALSVILFVILLCVFCFRRALKNGGVIRAHAQGPLAGIKVVDLSVVVAGPWVGAHLSELGAEVIKVESMDIPDSARGIGSGPSLGMAGMLAHTSKGKQSICLDLKSVKGLEVFKRIAEKCDVLIQNFRPGVMERLGISYEDIKTINPNIIYLSSSGFGSTGPYSKSRIYDMIIQAYTGISHIQGSEPPKLLPHLIMDKITAMTSTQTILAALVARDAGAGGQHLDMKMLNCGLQFVWPDTFHNHTWISEEDVKIQDSKVQIESKTEKMFSSIIGDLKVSKSLILPSEDAFDNYSTWKKEDSRIDIGKHILFGKNYLVRYPSVFYKTKLGLRPTCPMLGEHTAKLVKELGYTKAEIEEMLESKAIISTKSLLLQRGGDMAKIAKVFDFIEKRQGGPRIDEVPPRKWKKHAIRKDHTNGPLTGVKILEMSSLLAGPMASSMLGDQGADIIKVELEDSLDPSRKLGPSPHNPHLGSVFLAANRNKRSILIDLNLDESQKILNKLVQISDIIIIDTDIATTMDMKYNKAQQINSKVIYVEIDKGSGELACQASSGICEGVLDDDGQLVNINNMICEKITGYYAAIAATTAYFVKQRSNEGQRVGVNMMNSMMHYNMLDIFVNNTWEKKKTPSINIADLYRTQFLSKDKVIHTQTVISDKEFKGWADTNMDRLTEYKDKVEGKWQSFEGRIADVEELTKVFLEVTAGLNWDQVRERGYKADIAVAPFLSNDEVLKDPQVLHSQLVCSMNYENFGPYRSLIPASNFSKTPAKIRTPAPLPGAHTEAILKEIESLSVNHFLA